MNAVAVDWCYGELGIDEILSRLKIETAISNRRLRHFACACYKHVGNLMRDKKTFNKTLSFATKFADGLASKKELTDKAWGKTGEPHCVVLLDAWDAAYNSSLHARGIAGLSAITAKSDIYAKWQSDFDTAWKIEDMAKAREIADNMLPDYIRIMKDDFIRSEAEYQKKILVDAIAPPAKENCEYSEDEINVARKIYINEDWALLPKLIELLGRTNPFFPTRHLLSNHFQKTEYHIRGCWALDCILNLR